MIPYNKIFRMMEDWRKASPPDDPCSNQLKQILDNLEYLDRVKFQPFVPTLYSKHPASFMERFDKWLNNPGLSETQRRDLFEFANHIAFFSFDDFTALFQSAFTGAITRWCIDQTGIKLTDSNWRQRLDEERYEKTWFCPVTDSLLISVFHHVNQIQGKDRKPAFRDLAEFGDWNKVAEHIAQKGYKRLVLLEDFVGTGGQSMKAVKWALSNSTFPVLFCPIVVASEAVAKYHDIRSRLQEGRFENAKCPSFDVQPIFTLSKECFVSDSSLEQSKLMASIKTLAEEVHARLKKDSQGFEKGPLGWWDEDSPQQGATAVMFSNTPNNTIPLIHHEADSWKPLFPRVARQPL